MKKLICVLFAVFACCVLLGGCSMSDIGLRSLQVRVDLKYDGGKVENCGEWKPAVKGLPYTVKAYDTDEYEFWYWEKDGENVSEKKNYTFVAREETRLKAVFKPKAEDKVLVNVIAEPEAEYKWYKPENYPLMEEVGGAGYYTIGETVSLSSGYSCEMCVRSFTVGEETIDGPTWEFVAEETITVVAKLEDVVAVIVEDSPNCTVTRLTEEKKFFRLGDTLKLDVVPDEGYVMDTWRETWKDSFMDYSEYNQNYEQLPTYEMVINQSMLDNYTEVHVSAVCTNENLEDIYDIEVRSEDGATVQVKSFDKKIIGRDFLIWLDPAEDTYIQDIYLLSGYNIIQFEYVSFFDKYKVGGKVYVPDITEDFEDEVTIVIEAIKKENAAVVRVDSDDEEVMKDYSAGKKPVLPIVPRCEDIVIVAKKGEQFSYRYEFDRGVQAIYEMGYQFVNIVDEKGEEVADSLHFALTATEDMHLHIRYEKKPVFDQYFDYNLTDGGTGYVAKLSQLTMFRDCTPYVDSITLPAVYNGKPVKEIADYGMTQYRCANYAYEGSTYTPFKKLVLPTSIERIGKRAFAGWNMEIEIPETAELDYVSPDAFWSECDGVKVSLSKAHISVMLKALHDAYIGENDEFKVEYREDEHFSTENELGHYEALTEYVCIKESALNDISAFELSLFYHEFAHHYQIVATVGLGNENLENMQIKPTQTEIDGWKQEYDKDDYEKYWNHPMEVWARAFALEWTGFDQNSAGE